MVARQIRDVPDDVRQALAERARIQGQSPQAFLLGVVTDEARRSANLALLGRFEGRHDGSRFSAVDVVDELHQACAERDDHLMSLLSGATAPREDSGS